MSATTLNRMLRRPRHRLACLALVLCLGGAVVVHHLPTEHMAMGASMVMCVAVLGAGAALVARAGAALLPRLELNLPFVWPPARQHVARPKARARSSPVATVVLRR